MIDDPIFETHAFRALDGWPDSYTIYRCSTCQVLAYSQDGYWWIYPYDQLTCGQTLIRRIIE